MLIINYVEYIKYNINYEYNINYVEYLPKLSLFSYYWPIQTLHVSRQWTCYCAHNHAHFNVTLPLSSISLTNRSKPNVWYEVVAVVQSAADGSRVRLVIVYNFTVPRRLLLDGFADANVQQFK